MKIARFEAWPYVDMVHRDIRRLATPDGGTQWTPAVDIIEETDRFVVRTDLPGVNPEDIDVSMDNGVLTVSGGRQAPELAEESSVRRSERSNGRFLRSFTLPETADAERVTAKSGNGILDITIPKLAQVQPRRVTVQAA